MVPPPNLEGWDIVACIPPKIVGTSPECRPPPPSLLTLNCATVCLCIHIHTYTSIYIHIYIYTYIYLYLLCKPYKKISEPTHNYLPNTSYMHTCACMYECPCLCVFIYLFIYLFILSIHTLTHLLYKPYEKLYRPNHTYWLNT